MAVVCLPEAERNWLSRSPETALREAFDPLRSDRRPLVQSSDRSRRKRPGRPPRASQMATPGRHHRLCGNSSPMSGQRVTRPEHGRAPPRGHLAHQFPCGSTLDDDKTATGMRARACGYLLVLPSHGTKQTPEAIPWGPASTMYIDPETGSPLPLPTLLSRLRPNSWNSSIAPPYKGRNGRSAHRALPRDGFEPLQSTHHAGPHRSPAYGARAG
jgi:hypothetical protein